MAADASVPRAELLASGEDLLVLGAELARDRKARLFFRSILGATPVDGGWRCPRRRSSMGSLIVRVYDWLEAHGYGVDRAGAANEAISRELERRQSFQRTRLAVAGLRSGASPFSFAPVDAALEAYGWSRPLRSHQRDAVAHALTGVNVANFSVPGAGKTAATLAVAVTHLNAGTVDLAVVVGPLACFDPWEQETRITVGARIPVVRVRGPAHRRQAIYDSAKRGQLLLLSYATAAADQAALLDLFGKYNVMLVIDESHRIKRFRGGLWAPALAELARRSQVRLVLSGTPMPQSGRDLFSQMNVLWPDGQITGTRDAFAAKVDTNFPSVVREILPFTSRTPKTELGLPPYEVIREEVPLDGIQAEVYELIENRLRRDLSDAATWRDKLERLRRSRPIRLMQAASNPDLLNLRDSYYNVPRVSTDTPTLMERLADYSQLERPAKSIAALRLVQEIALRGEKVVCWSNFVANLDQFSRLIRETVGIPTYQIDGRVPAGIDALHNIPADALQDRPGEIDTRESVIHRFLGQIGPAVLVTNPASCSESISLHTSCHNAIYLDRTYDCAQFLQSIDRLHRLGLPPDVTVRIYILTATLDDRPIIDGLIDIAISRKEAQMRQLLEGAELAPIVMADDPINDAEGDDADLGDLLRYLLGVS